MNKWTEKKNKWLCERVRALQFATTRQFHFNPNMKVSVGWNSMSSPRFTSKSRDIFDAIYRRRRHRRRHRHSSSSSQPISFSLIAEIWICGETKCLYAQTHTHTKYFCVFRIIKLSIPFGVGYIIKYSPHSQSVIWFHSLTVWEWVISLSHDGTENASRVRLMLWVCVRVCSSDQVLIFAPCPHTNPICNCDYRFRSIHRIDLSIDLCDWDAFK